MKKLICLTILSGLFITTNVIAKCDPENANTSSANPVWDPDTGSTRPYDYTFVFKRSCDELEKPCSQSVKLLVTADGKTKTYHMDWIVKGWYAEVGVMDKNPSYQIRYWDTDSRQDCTTLAHRF